MFQLKTHKYFGLKCKGRVFAHHFGLYVIEHRMNLEVDFDQLSYQWVNSGYRLSPTH